MVQPSIFISHGGPNIVTDESKARDFLTGLSGQLERPDAIVIASAHFETDGPAVVADPAPDMIYDFRGFPQELYEIVYPAPGSPQLARRTAGLLEQAGLEPRMVEKRGYDHGAWTPLHLAFPQADIPVVQLSIDPNADAAYHQGLGRALEPLRKDNVLVIGSGHITHNLKEFFGVVRGGEEASADTRKRINAFTGWFADRFADGDEKALLNWNEAAPFAAYNHPTDEHLMPLFVAWGAGGQDAIAKRIHSAAEYGFFAFDAWRFD